MTFKYCVAALRSEGALTRVRTLNRTNHSIQPVKRWYGKLQNIQIGGL